jgi:EmrB/QacA subfamily drug resistance transporter
LAVVTKMNRRVLVVAILGSTMAFLDSTVVNVALPVLQRELVADAAQMQWIVEAYALFLAALVLVGGALGDRWGRKRVFLFGVTLFACASVACGLSPGATPLVVARAVQGVGAAMLVPGSLALISAAHPDERTRGAAIGTWSSASAITAAIGPVLGGWIVERASWRWIFFLNVPFAVIVIALCARGVPETRDDEAHGRLDVVGALLAVVGLGAVVYALLESPAAGGLGRPRVLAPLLGGVGALVAFVFVEARASSPMMPLSLFRVRAFAVTNVLTFLLYGALGGCLFFLPFDLVQVRHFSPAVAGASLLPFVVLISVLSPFAGKLAAIRGARLPLVVGPAISAGGFALLAAPTAAGSFWTAIFPGICAIGLGMGVTVAPLTSTVMGAVETRHAGAASGINNAVARAAGLLAVAAFAVAFDAWFDGALDRSLAALPLSPRTLAVIAEQRGRLAGADLRGVDDAVGDLVRRAFDDAFVSAFRATMLTGAALAALSACVALAVGRGSNPRAAASPSQGPS